MSAGLCAFYIRKTGFPLIISQMPEVHENIKYANQTRIQCVVTAPYCILLCNVCTAHKLIFLSEVSVLCTKCICDCDVRLPPCILTLTTCFCLVLRDRYLLFQRLKISFFIHSILIMIIFLSSYMTIFLLSYITVLHCHGTLVQLEVSSFLVLEFSLTVVCSHSMWRRPYDRNQSLFTFKKRKSKIKKVYPMNTLWVYVIGYLNNDNQTTLVLSVLTFKSAWQICS